MPCTRPCMSRSGPPLLPGSTGMASWIIFRPSTSRTAETTPPTTLYFSPFGLPSATTAWPSLSASESPSGSGVRSLASILMTARSRLRSWAWTAVDVVLLAVGELDGDRPALADDVDVGGDQPVGRDDEAGAEPLALRLAAAGGDDAQGRLDLLGQLLDGLRLRLVGRRGKGEEQKDGDDGTCEAPGGEFIVQAPQATATRLAATRRL